MTQGQRVGALAGAIGGLIFVLVNAGAVGASLGVVARVVAVGLFLAVLVLVVIPAPTLPDAPPDRRQIRVYGVSVVAMVAAILGGGAVLRAVGLADLQLLWVVLVVGVHFLPLAQAFDVAVLRWLGLAMAAVAVVGALVVLLTPWPGVAGAAATVAGLVMLVVALAPRRAATTRGH